tara:strand:+ start:139 stop:693 length:555 start_codon:yes stop_codon:yes gene_type:complete
MNSITIDDPVAGLKKYVLKGSIPTSRFLKHMKHKGAKFTKFATVIKDNNKAPGYSYQKLLNNKEKGWVYIVSINNKVVKIGQTDATLSSRFSSYQAGTRKNREKGTCSVTNWYCSEVWREALDSDLSVEIYVYPVPTTVTNVPVFGDIISVRNKHAYVFEHALLNEYQFMSGGYPILSNNNSEA